MNYKYLKGLFLTWMHPIATAAFSSMMEMSKDEAVTFSTKFNLAKRAGLGYGAYYDERKKVEEVNSSIKKHGFLLDLKASPRRYIEVQVWASDKDMLRKTKLSPTSPKIYKKR